MPGAVSAIVLPTAIAVAASCGAVTLLMIGLRGRRLDDHPICRRCGFDLYGRGPRDLACWECGADLTRRGAIQLGSRVRNPIALTGSFALVLVAVAAVAQFASVRVDGNWRAYAPTNWLVRDAGSAQPAVRDAALSELTRRVRNGTLSADLHHSLVELALAHQADGRKPWAPAWGDLVEAARAVGRVSDEQWRRYQVQAVTFTLVPSLQPRWAAQTVSFQIGRGPDRLASRPSFRTTVAIYADPRVEICGYRPANNLIPREPEVALFREGALPAVTGMVPVAVLDVPPRYGAPGPLILADVAPTSLEALSGLIAEGPQTARASLAIRPIRRYYSAQHQVTWYEAEPGERRIDAQTEWTMPR